MNDQSLDDVLQPIRDRIIHQGAGSRLFRAMVVFLLVAPAICISVFCYSLTVQLIRHNIIAERQAQVNLSASLVHEKMDTVRNAAMSLARLPSVIMAVKQGDWEGAIHRVEAAVGAFVFVDRVFVADPEGVIRADFPHLEDAAGASRKNADWYKGVSKQGAPYVSVVFKRAGQPSLNVVDVAVPVFTANDSQVIGILVLQIPLDRFAMISKDLQHKEGETFYVVDHVGNLVHHPQYSPQNDIMNFSNVPVVQDVLKGKDGVSEYYDSILKEKQLAVYKPVSKFGWGVVISQPANVVMGKYNMFLLLFGAVLVLVCLLLVAVVLICLYFFSKVHFIQEHQRLVVDSAAEGIYGVDLEGKCTFCNAACLRLLGYADPTEFIGKVMHWQIHHSHEDGSRFPVEECRIWRTLETGEGSHMDSEVFWRKDDTSFSAEYFSFPIRKDGQTVGAVVSFMDITERKRLQEELVSYKDHLEELVQKRTALLKEAERGLREQKKALDEHSIVAVVDPKGIITYVNDKFCQISGYSREELIGKDNRIVNSGHHPKEFFADLWDTVSSGNVWHGKIRNQAKNGNIYWIRGTILPFLDENGGIKEYISVQTEITRSVQNEEHLEQSMHVKTNFITIVSNELRTPLASIKSSVDILNTGGPGTLTDEQKTFLGRVKSNIDRLAWLINDVLDLSKLESSKIPMNLEPLRPEDVVREALDAQSEAAKNKGIALSVELGSDLPMFMADKDRLLQVFNNLLSNALRITKEGAVTVGASCEEGKTLRFWVRDAGEGIKKVDLPKLFQQFQQGSGTGFGLAICREVVERHGGEIWCESELGKGSTFIFTIPVKHEKRVLIIDNDRLPLEMLKDILGKTGKYEVELAADGFTAGVKCLDFAPQLIILDMDMPHFSALEACARIKKAAKTSQTKIIMFGNFTEETEKQARAAGADDILKKPGDAAELLLKVGKLI